MARLVELVATSELFSSEQRHEIDSALRAAETSSRFEFSVFVGNTEGDPRDFAERLHASLKTPDRSIMIVVDPQQRVLQVVTGDVVRRVLPDDDVRLAVVTMRSAFADGDLVGGLTRGLAQLADHARAPRTLHTDTP